MMKYQYNGVKTVEELNKFYADNKSKLFKGMLTLLSSRKIGLLEEEKQNENS